MDYFESYFKNKSPDCTLYSEDGGHFRIHKEIFGQTEFMREILNTTNEHCCGTIEIFCPCSKEDLDHIVQFLYSGNVTLIDKNEPVKVVENLMTINENLSKIFGFPKNFCLHHQKKTVQNYNIKPSRIYIDVQFATGDEIFEDTIFFEDKNVETTIR